LKLRLDEIRLPNGKQSQREVVEHSDAVAVVAVDDDNNILLVKQFRQPMAEELLELPAGCVDLGEEPAATVSREMREETGYKPNKIEKLGGFYSSPGFCTEYMHIFLATNLVDDNLQAEDTDRIELVHVPLEEVEGLIDSGAIRDAKSIAGLLLYLKSLEKT
jgi:ADP-ribose pyrophosphatase